jgi:hypothetical protein
VRSERARRTVSVRLSGKTMRRRAAWRSSYSRRVWGFVPSSRIVFLCRGNRLCQCNIRNNGATGLEYQTGRLVHGSLVESGIAPSSSRETTLESIHHLSSRAATIRSFLHAEKYLLQLLVDGLEVCSVAL